MAIRRALAFSAIDRYAAMLVSIAVLAATSRILSPTEIGTAVLGLTIFALIEIIRDVPTAYLLQQSEAREADVRSAFTVMGVISLLAAAFLVLAAPFLASMIGNERMEAYLRVVALALLAGPFERPLIALMRRDMAFDQVALVNLASGICNAAVVISLALMGFGELSFAWALLAANIAAVAAVFVLSPHRGMLGVGLSEWRRVIIVGGSSGLWGLMWRFTDSLPHMIFGALGVPAATGTYSRAQTIVEMPGRLLFTVINQVALPALAAHQREGRDTKVAVRDSIAIISALQWPTFLLLACLAHPLVMLLLGPQWIEIVPLVQVLSLARLFAVLDIMVYPVLMASRETGRLLLSAAIPMCLFTPLVVLAAPHGTMAVGLIYLLLVPIEATVSYAVMRKRLRLGVGELLSTLYPSMLVALGSIVGPLAIVAARGFRLDLSLGEAVVAGLTALAGWGAAIVVSGHRLGAEIRQAAHEVRRWAAPRWRVGS